VTSRIQPNTIEEACLQTAQHVGNGHNIHNQAELQQHNELRHCWLPGQNNSLPFLIKNKTTRKHTHTHDDRLIMWTFSNFNISTHPNLLNFQSKTSTSWHNIFKTFLQILASQSQMFCEPSFCSFKFNATSSIFLVMSVGFPLFMQTNPTSGKFWL
jgi:hypothetical protein